MIKILLSPFEIAAKVILGVAVLVAYPVIWLYQLGDWYYWEMQ